MKYRLRRKHWISIVLLLLAIPAGISQSEGSFITIKKGVMTNQPGLYGINHFVDGDTIAVDMNGTSETVRFIGERDHLIPDMLSILGGRLCIVVERFCVLIGRLTVFN